MQDTSPTARAPAPGPFCVTLRCTVAHAWRRMLRRRQAAAAALVRVVRHVADGGSRAFARGAPDAAPAKAAKGGRQKGGGERNVRARSLAFRCCLRASQLGLTREPYVTATERDPARAHAGTGREGGGERRAAAG